MKKSLRKRCMALLCAVGMMLLVTAFAILHAGAAEKTYPLNINCAVDNKAVVGVKWKLYLIGERTDNKKGNTYSLALNKTFAKYNVSTSNMTASDIADLANTLAVYVQADKITPSQSGTTDSRGNLSFDKLPEGVYLLCGEQLTVGDKIYIPAPSIVESGSNMYKQGYTVYPKFEIRDVPEKPKTEYSVTKSWEDNGNSQGLRPYGVDVEIYADGKLYKEVRLNSSNNWSYSWQGDSDSVWTVVEKNVPDKYNVVVRSTAAKFVIVNTIEETTTTTTTTTTTAKPLETTTKPSETTTTTNTSISTSATVPGVVTTSSQVTSQPDVTTLPTESVESGLTTPQETTATQVTTSDTEIPVTTTAPVTTEQTPATTTRKTSGGEVNLPQTGQLWWPVPLLIVGGIICIGVGVSLKKNSK